LDYAAWVRAGRPRFEKEEDGGIDKCRTSERFERAFQGADRMRSARSTRKPSTPPWSASTGRSVIEATAVEPVHPVDELVNDVMGLADK
jgi:hypothetical protein